MVIVDPSNPKASLRSLAGSNADPTSIHDDILPGYTPLSPPVASGSQNLRQPSHITNYEDNFQTFNAESIENLNPESSKKLLREARESGNNVGDYGFVSCDMPAGISGLPPTFEEGERRIEYNIDSSGNIVSHDELLNTSPLALSRFLQLQSSSPPSLSIHLRGSHTEFRSETITELHNGQTRTRTERKHVEVEDFEFRIDAKDEVESALGKARGGGMRGNLYAVGDWELEHRGGAWRSIGARGETGHEGGEGAIRLPVGDEERGTGEGDHGNAQDKWKIPGWSERKKLDAETRGRAKMGYPGFVDPESLTDDSTARLSSDLHPPLLLDAHFLDLAESHSSNPNTSDSSLRTTRIAHDAQILSIIEAYCSSTKILKELVVKKELYGWNWGLLEDGLRVTIKEGGYEGRIQILFKVSPDRIVVRPRNNWSRIFSIPAWGKILLWICLIYPILLLIELLSGDRYSNLRIAFPLTRWRRLPLPASSSSTVMSASEALSTASTLSRRSKPKIAQTGQGEYVYLVGTQEGEWLRAWEGGIVQACRMGKRGVVLNEDDRAMRPILSARDSLRGYHDRE